jgi:hypothetical protein
MIQYPPTMYYDSLQRPFVVDSVLVRSALIDTKGGDKCRKKKIKILTTEVVILAPVSQ